MRVAIVATLVALAAVSVAVQASQTPAVEPVYAVSFTLGPGDEQVFTGTTTFRVAAKGVVSGTMSINNPLTIRAALAGSVAGGAWTFEFPYENVDEGCVGVVKGTAKVPADRKLISGNATIGGDCSPEGVAATFSFTQQQKE